MPFETDETEPEGRIWLLAEGLLSPESIVDEAYALSEHLPGEFSPPTEEGATSESGSGSTKLTTTRFGNDTQGFERVRTEYAGSGMTSDSVTVTAYGLTEGLDLSLTWATTTLPTRETVMNIAIRIAAPWPVLDSMGEVIGERFEVASVSPF